MRSVRSLPLLPVLMALGCPTSTGPEPAANDPACSTPLCPNDPPYTSDQIDECNRVLDGSCGVTYRALLDCAVKNRDCDPAGHSDQGAIESACASEQSVYEQCTPGVPDAAIP